MDRLDRLTAALDDVESLLDDHVVFAKETAKGKKAPPNSGGAGTPAKRPGKPAAKGKGKHDTKSKKVTEPTTPKPKTKREADAKKAAKAMPAAKGTERKVVKKTKPKPDASGHYKRPTGRPAKQGPLSPDQYKKAHKKCPRGYHEGKAGHCESTGAHGAKKAAPKPVDYGKKPSPKPVELGKTKRTAPMQIHPEFRKGRKLADKAARHKEAERAAPPKVAPKPVELPSDHYGKARKVHEMLDRAPGVTRKKSKTKRPPNAGGAGSHDAEGKLKKKAKTGKASAHVVLASPAEWDEAVKLVAMYTPNLRLLKRRIHRGVVSSDEIVQAVVEALRRKHVSPRLCAAVADVLTDALNEGEVINMNAEDDDEGPEDEYEEAAA